MRMMRAAFGALTLMAAPASAQTPVTNVTDGAPLFSFQAPDDWIVRTGFEVNPSMMAEGETPVARIVSLEPQNSEAVMWVGLWSPRRLADIEESADWIESLGGGLMRDARIESSRVERINGMNARVYSGRGLAFDRPVLFDLALVQVSPQDVAAGAFIGEARARETFGPALTAILRSMEAVR